MRRGKAMYSEVITGFLPGLGNILRCKKLLIGVQKISDTVKKSISKYDLDLDPFFSKDPDSFFPHWIRGRSHVALFPCSRS